MYDSEGGGYASPETKEALLALEKKKRQLLEAKEKEWRLKSRALWLQSGDENTKFFQAYEKGRKMVNTIWSLNDTRWKVYLFFRGPGSDGVQAFPEFI
jgi:hypothetical protein